MTAAITAFSIGVLCPTNAGATIAQCGASAQVSVGALQADGSRKATATIDAAGGGIEGVGGSEGARFVVRAGETSVSARLLIDRREQRIGCLKNGAEDIKKHKWFRGLNWAALYNKQMEPPMVPDLRSDDDTRYYATYPDSVEESGPLLTAPKQKLFDFWC